MAMAADNFQRAFSVDFLFQPAQGLFHWLAFFKSDFGQCLSLPFGNENRRFSASRVNHFRSRDLLRKNPLRGLLAKNSGSDGRFAARGLSTGKSG